MRRILAFVMCVAMVTAVSGCGALLERDYIQVTDHVDHTADTDDATALRAESYADLVSSAQYFVTMGATTGTVHLYQYTGDIEQAVNNACNAILQDDPVGAYALQDVTCEYTHIVSYYECVFTYRYRRTMDEIAAIQSVNGKAAFRRQVAAALTSFSNQLVLKTSSYYESVETVQKAIWEVYYDTPEAALAMPEIHVQLYPDQGEARVVEINLDWGVERSVLEKQTAEVSAAAARIVGEDSGTDATTAWLLYTRLRSGLAMAQGELNTLGDREALQTRREAIQEELDRRRAEYDALGAALAALEQAHSGLQARFSPALNRRAGELLAELTGGKYDKVALTQQFEALAEEHDGLQPRRALTLSQGTADQLYLAVRLAVCELVLPAEEPCPLVLDDALANFDDGRCALALEALARLGEERQILLFTCHSREARLAEGREGAAVLRLQS